MCVRICGLSAPRNWHFAPSTWHLAPRTFCYHPVIVPLLSTFPHPTSPPRTDASSARIAT